MGQTSHKLPLQDLLMDFAPISLADMNRVRLLDRQDTKMVLPVWKLLPIIQGLSQDYRILETEGSQVSSYRSLYYDTKDWQSYREHHNQRKNRYKIRYRSYVGSDVHFFEIKHKTNKNRTIKTRIETDGIKTSFGVEESKLLNEHTPLNPFDFSPTIWVNYKRITLVGNN